MKPWKKWAALAGAVVLAGAVLGSCATVNRLDRYSFDGATLAANLRIPPEPKFDIFYVVKFNSRNPVGTALSLGSNIAVAAEAQRAKERMRSALLAVDVPATVLNQTYTSSAQALGARKVFARSRATYLLDIEIREYGIHASSPNGAVSMVMRLTARLYDSANRELLWRRNVTIDQQASPYMFGFGSVIGNVVTAGTLANLTTAEMERGFSQLARESSLSLARKLERDLYSARYR